ncbi:MAG: flagellar hook-associated protein FlgK [Gemmobacter sp.]
MSISGTVASALSGLTVAARAAELVSSNVANARTEGYARRSLEITPRTVGATGQGVQVAAVVRATDPVVTGDRRLAEAGAAERQARADFLSGIESLLGSPEEEGSLTARVAALDAALIEAASRPDAETRLAAVLDAARGVMRTLSATATEVQRARETADGQIGASVRQINDALSGIAAFNAQILSLGSTGRDTSALMDQRQRLIDGIAPLIPLREVDRGGGQIALYSSGGAVLIDGSRPAQLGFTPAGVVTAEMTLASGALSGLTLNGRAISMAEGGPLSGGALSAQFALRDSVAPEVQAQLDRLARDLVERFADPAVDGTLVTGDAGLFTDLGGPFLAANEAGLSTRLRLNPAVDPAQGGQIWRLRDGVRATAPGPAGESRLLVALRDALVSNRAPSPGETPRSHAVLAAQVVSGLAADRLSAETEASYGTARADALRVLELENGVDTDRELQDLLMIEQAYAANARVLRTVDEMIQLLLGV